MLSNTTEIGTTMLPLQRVTRPARTDVSPSAQHPATYLIRLSGQTPPPYPRASRPRFPAIALAALACVLALAALATPARAQTTFVVWTATLTPAVVSSFPQSITALGCLNISFKGSSVYCSNTSVLSEDKFTYDRTDYGVAGLTLTVHHLQFSVGVYGITPATEALTLVTGGRSFRLADAMRISPGLRSWPRRGLSWTVGNAVSVSLTGINHPPTFSAGTAARSVAENTAAGQDVGAALTATDADSDRLTYTLEGTDAASFDIVTASGTAQIRTKAGVTYNHEAKSTYTVIVKADDGKDATGTITVTITVTDVNEPPGRPAAPSVSATAESGTSLDVTWTAPSNTGPAITSYDLQYREGASGNFTDGPQNVTGTSAAIGSLMPNTSYEVQVRATNADGDGDWSASGTGQTGASPSPGAPAAPSVSATARSTTSLDVTWTAPSNTGPAITSYDLQYREGASGNFTDGPQDVTGTSAAIGSLMPNTSYEVQVRATNADGDGDWSLSGTGQTGASLPPGPSVPPGVPAPPSVSATAESTTSLAVSWTAPSNTGPAITSYDLQYREGASGNFTDGPQNVTGTSAAIGSLMPNTSYEVQVRATNADGDGDWSASGTGQTLEPLLEAELFSTAAVATEGGPLVIRVRRSGGLAYAAYGYIGVTDSAMPDVTAAAVGRSDGLGRHRLEFATGATEATVTVIPAFDGELGEGRVITATLESVELEIGGPVRTYELGPAELEFAVTDTDAMMSVSDAWADAESPLLVYTVSLDRTRDVPVRVDYATEDGTARAGEDYTAVSGTLVIEAGGREAKVGVPLLTAPHLTSERTLVLRLLNARNARLENGTATGTIHNSDPLLRVWLARFGRTVGTHVVDAVGTRLRGAPGVESHVTVGGYRLPLEKSTAGEPEATTPGGASERAQAARLWGPLPGGTSPGAEPEGRLAALVTGLAGVLGVGRAPAGGADAAGSWADQPAGDPRLGQSQPLHVPALRQVLVGSSFRLHLSGDLRDSATPRLTAWGRFAGTTFDGRDGALPLSGEVLTGTLGVDREWERWLAGVGVSHSRGDGSYTTAGNGGDRELENAMTSIHPYLRYAVNERLDVWGVLGYGGGDVTLKPDPGATRETGTTLVMGAFGGRGLLLAAADTGGFQLATRTDAMLTRTTSDAVAGLQALEADAHRLRLVLEGTREVRWPEGRRLTPAVEIGLRHDWGDAESGFGLELGGRVQYADPRLGLTIEAAVRGLLAHEDSDYGEWGASGSLRFAPDTEGQGLALTLRPTWGAAASGVAGLWSRPTTTGLALPGGPRSATGRLHAEVGYGIAAFDTGLLTPYAGTVLAAGAARMYRVGTRLELTGGWTTGVTLSLEGQRQEPVGPQPINQSLQFQAAWGF